MGIEKLDEKPDEFVVEGGINKLTKAMSREFGVGIHRLCERGAIDHGKSLQKLPSVLVLGDKIALRSLPDLEPKKEMKKTHVGHFKFAREGSFGGGNVGTVATGEDKIVDIEDKKGQQAITMEDVKVGVNQKLEKPCNWKKVSIR